MDDRSSNQHKAALLHKIRNCLNPLQTFLDVVDISKKDSKLQNFHKTCRENFTKVMELLKELDQI